MLNEQQQQQIMEQAGKRLGKKLSGTEIPRQGMEGEVFLCVNEKGTEYALKISADALNDAIALEMIAKSGLDIPVPKVFDSFPWDDKTVLVMERIRFPLLEEVSKEEKCGCIQDMIDNLRKIHQIRSDKAGTVAGSDAKSWKELLLYKYSGQHPLYPWDEIVQRDGVDEKLLRESISKIIDRIGNLDFPEKDYSLLHTDFNQRNLFVDPVSGRIVSIIDWSEAMFGDPLYDFARVRMFIIHFDLEDAVLGEYLSILSMAKEERVREETYLLSQIIDYITWYSGKKDKFNRSRLRLHQEFLRKYGW